MKYQVLFSLENNEKVFINVVCCSRDWRFKGYNRQAVPPVLREHRFYENATCLSYTQLIFLLI